MKFLLLKYLNEHEKYTYGINKYTNMFKDIQDIQSNFILIQNLFKSVVVHNLICIYSSL